MKNGKVNEMKRRDKCKCGRVINWDTENNTAKCKSCNTEYQVDCDSVLVYWLVEKIPERKKWRTDPK